MSKVSVKKGDTVLVIAGKDKDAKGKVLAVNPEQNRVLVEGVNIVSKCKKARTAQEKSEIIKREAGIDASNVMVICPACGKATRVAHNIVDGKKVRVCKKCSASLDKEFVKEVKKSAKASKAPKEEPAVKAEKKTAKKSTKSSKSVDEKKTTKKSTKEAK